LTLSIVTSTYQPELNFVDFLDEIRKLAESAIDFELVVVEDSSSHEAVSFVHSMLEERFPSKYKLFVNNRNYGQHRSLFIGLGQSKGDFVALIDSDNEENPLEILNMLQLLKNAPNSDVVYCFTNLRRNRLHSLLRKVFYMLFKRLAPEIKHQSVTTLRLARKSLIEKVLLNSESSINIGALFSSLDSNPIYIEIVRTYKGFTSYSFGKRLRLAIHSIVSFSNTPLSLAGLLGLFGFVASVFSACYALFSFYFYGSISGWTSIFLLVSTVSGLILLSLGILSTYLAMLMIEIKKRPFISSRYPES
jgi:glycosyltransferase involved in cell wall biosynthesis